MNIPKTIENKKQGRDVIEQCYTASEIKSQRFMDALDFIQYPCESDEFIQKLDSWTLKIRARILKFKMD